MKKYFISLTLLFLSSVAYTQILIDDGPIIIDKKTSISPDYVIQGNSWNHRILTYWFSNGTADISGTEEKTAIQTALGLWQNQTDIRFLEVCDSISADIIFRWGQGDHGCGFPFDHTDGVLAHAFAPPPNGNLAGDVHFDDIETWTTATRSSPSQPIDLITIAAHEIGHSLGLNHSSISTALMYAYYSGSHRYLDQDDINGIRSIYGNPGTYNFVDGPSIVCSSGATFFISSPQPVTSIIWECGPNLTISSGQNTNSCTFSVDGNSSSWVRASLVIGCGTITLPQKTVGAGGPQTPVISGPGGLHCGDQYSFSVAEQSSVAGTTYFWDSNVLEIEDSNLPTCKVSGYFNGNKSISCTVTACGVSKTTTKIVNVNSCDLLLFSPNPATDQTIVSIESGAQKDGIIAVGWDMEVYDQGQLLKIRKTQLKNRTTTLNTSGWKDGVYIVRAIIGEEVISEKLVVKH